jgi:hypothetical protein
MKYPIYETCSICGKRLDIHRDIIRQNGATKDHAECYSRLQQRSRVFWSDLAATARDEQEETTP